MDNQHRKISGYRDLSQEEIDLINDIKAAGADVQRLFERIYVSNALANGISPDMRAAAIAQTHLQTGFMWLARAVAKPEGF